MSSLLKEHRERLLHGDRLTDLLEELVLGGVVSNTTEKLVELRSLSLDSSSNLLLLSLKGLVLLEVLDETSLLGLKHFVLIGGSGVDLHELFDGVELVDHSHTLRHDILFATMDDIQLSKLLLDVHDNGVLSDSA